MGMPRESYPSCGRYIQGRSSLLSSWLYHRGYPPSLVRSEGHIHFPQPGYYFHQYYLYQVRCKMHGASRLGLGAANHGLVASVTREPMVIAQNEATCFVDSTRSPTSRPHTLFVCFFFSFCVFFRSPKPCPSCLPICPLVLWPPGANQLEERAARLLGLYE